MLILVEMLILVMFIVSLSRFPKKVKYPFVLLSLSSGAFVACIFLVQQPWVSSEIKLYCFKTIFACGSMMTLATFLFLIRLGEIKTNSVLFFTVTGSLFLLSVLSFSDLFVVGVRDARWPVYGDFRPVYLFLNFLFFIGTIWILRPAISRDGEPLLKFQMNYIVKMILIVGIGIFLTNVAYPILTKRSDLSDFGPFWVASFNMAILLLVLYGKQFYLWKESQECIENNAGSVLVSFGEHEQYYLQRRSQADHFEDMKVDTDNSPLYKALAVSNKQNFDFSLAIEFLENLFAKIDEVADEISQHGAEGGVEVLQRKIKSLKRLYTMKYGQLNKLLQTEVDLSPRYVELLKKDSDNMTIDELDELLGLYAEHRLTYLLPT